MLPRIRGRGFCDIYKPKPKKELHVNHVAHFGLSKLSGKKRMKAYRRVYGVAAEITEVKTIPV